MPSSFSSTRAVSVSGKERKGALEKDMHIAPIQAKCAEHNRELATLTMIEIKGVRTVFWWTQKADE